MSEILNSAIVKVQNAKYAFCRFITANDTGKNGSHQAGFYIPKCAAALLFDTPGVKGENKDKMVKVKWQDDFTTDSRFIYYGQGTRNEYRITRFGKGFPFFDGRQRRRFAHYCPTERRLLLWFRLADRSGH